jgi:hypothetical protein
LESLSARRERWRVWREAYGAACSIKWCAPILTNDFPEGYSQEERQQMQADAHYLALIALEGSAKDWFLSDSKNTIYSFLSHFSTIFAPSERKDQESITREWEDLSLAEDGDAMKTWTALKTLNESFLKCSAENTFLDTPRKRAVSFLAKAPRGPGQTWEKFNPSKKLLKNEAKFVVAMAEHVALHVAPILRKRASEGTLPTVSAAPKDAIAAVGTGLLTNKVAGCDTCGRTNHTTAEHKTSRQLQEERDRTRRDRRRDHHGRHRTPGRKHRRSRSSSSSSASDASHRGRRNDSRTRDREAKRFKGSCYACGESHRVSIALL